jgi:cytochrome c biogenesis protein CcdA
MEIPVALAFTAGLVATVNPCGFAMLPAYLALFLGLEGDDPATGPRAVGRALRVGLVVSTGFVAVFAVAGALLTLGVQAVVGWLRRSSRHVPRVAGAIMVLAGGYIVWFWVTTLAGDGLQQSTAVVAVERASSVMTNLIGDAVGLVALLLAGVLTVAGATAWWAARRARAEVSAPRPTAPRRPSDG